PGERLLITPAGRSCSDNPDRSVVDVDARENLSVRAYWCQRQSHDKSSSNSCCSRHDVAPVQARRLGGARLLLAVRVKSGAKDAETYADCSCADLRISDTGD